MAAKRLQDLAQGYGSKENIGVLVVRLNTDSSSSYGKLRKRHRSLSNDEDMMSQSTIRSSRMPDSAEYLYRQTIREYDSDNTLTAQASSSNTLRYVSASSFRDSQSNMTLTENSMQTIPESEHDEVDESNSEHADVVDSRVDLMDESLKSTVVPPPTSFADPPSQLVDVPLRPLPNQRFRKKNAATEWDGILQKRLMEDVKDKEVRHSMSQLLGIETENDLPNSADEVDDEPQIAKSHDQSSNWTSLNRKGGLSNSRTWKVAAPFPGLESKANPAYALTDEPTDFEIINMTTETRMRPSVRSAIAQFENLNKESNSFTSPPGNTRLRHSIQPSNSTTYSSKTPPRPTTVYTFAREDSSNNQSKSIQSGANDSSPRIPDRHHQETSNVSSVVSSLSSLTASELSTNDVSAPSSSTLTNDNSRYNEPVGHVSEYMFSDSSLAVEEPSVAYVQVDVHRAAESSFSGLTNSDASSSQSLIENKRKSQDDLTEVGVNGSTDQPTPANHIKQPKLEEQQINGANPPAEDNALSDTGHIYPTRMTNSNVQLVEITHI